MRSIRDIPSRDDAMAEALRRWRHGNDAGDGYAWDAGDETGAERILTARSDTEVDVYHWPGGREVAVGQASGAWAVTLGSDEPARAKGTP